MRARVHPLAFFLLNVVFIALLQHLLLAAITAPAWLAFKVRAQQGGGTAGRGVESAPGACPAAAAGGLPDGQQPSPPALTPAPCHLFRTVL